MRVRAPLALRRSASAKAARVSTAIVAVKSSKPGYEFDGLWYPGATPPKHLRDSDMPGNYGFDPLRLGANEESVKYYQEAELMNGRYAMLAVAGILFTDANGIGPWWEAGSLDYGIPTPTLVAIEVAVMGLFEYKRIENWKKTGESSILGWAPFDPMGMNSPEMKLKEIKNARAAMLAFLGFVSQAAILGKGPIECLQLHLADQTHNNIYTSQVGGEFTAAVVALSIVPMFIESQKTLQEDDEEEFRPIPW
jgi:hypothetical protein